jgi:hypothetical protein
MPTDRKLLVFEAITAGADVPKNEPTSASLNFWLSNGQALTVLLPRRLLEGLHSKIERALLKAPVPAQRRLSVPSANPEQMMQEIAARTMHFVRSKRHFCFQMFDLSR